MNNELKQQIEFLRFKGYSYSRIATLLGLKRSSVSSYCLRNHIVKPEFCVANEEYGVCHKCGRIFLIGKGNVQEFCSDKCRTDYWKDQKRIQKLLDEEAENRQKLQNELDFLLKQSDEWCGDKALQLCRTKDSN